MEEKPRSVISSALYYGLITGAGLIVFSLVIFLLGLHLNRAVTWISYLVLIAGMIWGTLDYRKKHSGGFLSFGKAFGSCFWIGLFAGILSSIYFFVFIQYIHPGFTNELIDQMRINMQESSPNMSEDDIEQAIAMSSKFMTPGMMVGWGMVTYAAISAVIGLILAIFLKKEDPSLKEQM